MPRKNYLKREFVDTLQPGDLVFHITDIKRHGPPWHSSRLAHVGIVAKVKMSHQLNEAVIVCHMDDFVTTSEWERGRDYGVAGGEDLYRVDLGVDKEGMDDFIRSKIVDTSMKYVALSSELISLISTHKTVEAVIVESLYWLGAFQIDGHPNHPEHEGLYAFSCATFAYHCYSECVPGVLIDQDSMPIVQRSAVPGKLRRYLPDGPVRIMFPGYLIGAIEADEIPFRPHDWEYWQDHTNLIPAELRAGARR